ncbi:MAG: MarR family transcriptional regulator [Lachnospiraceae bacterium]|nr:MarR family transcriptional regulator [Lachnospiraceae bacterium]
MSEIVYSKCILGLANRIRRIYNISTDNQGVQTRILHFLLVNYSERDIYQKDIEEELNIGSASISVLLKKLEGDEMIVRERVSHDDRLKKIRPTSAGIELKERVEQNIRSVENRLVSEISEEELNVFFRVIQKMIKNTSE